MKPNDMLGYCSVMVMALGVCGFAYASASPAATIPAETQPTASGQSTRMTRDAPDDLEVFRNFLEVYLHKTHGVLFVKLEPEIPPETLSKLRQLLLTRDLETAQISKYSTVGRPQTKSLVSAIKADVNQQIKDILPPESFASFRIYDESQSERRVVNSINQILIYKQEPLTPEQFDYMVSLLHTHQSETLALDASLEAVDASIAKRRLVHREILETAKPQLTDKQLAEFKTEFDIELAYMAYFKMRKANSISAPAHIAGEQRP